MVGRVLEIGQRRPFQVRHHVPACNLRDLVGSLRICLLVEHVLGCGLLRVRSDRETLLVDNGFHGFRIRSIVEVASDDHWTLGILNGFEQLGGYSNGFNGFQILDSTIATVSQRAQKSW